MANIVRVSDEARHLLWAEGIMGQIYLKDKGPKGSLAGLAQKAAGNYRRIKARGYRAPKWDRDELRGLIREANRFRRASGYKAVRVAV